MDEVVIPPSEPPLSAPPLPQHRSQWSTWGEILLCSGYPTQLLLASVLQVSGLAPLRADGSLSAPFVFALSLIDTVLLLSLIMIFLVRRGEHPGRVFFGERPVMPEVAAGVLSVPFVVAMVLGVSVLLHRFAPALRTVPNNPLEGFLGTQTGFVMFLVVVIVAGGIREELQRAFLLHRFRGDLGQPWMGVFITSLAFGMGHTLQGLDVAVITGALGAVWGVMYLVRGSAIATIVSHALFNSSELLRAFLR